MSSRLLDLFFVDVEVRGTRFPNATATKRVPRVKFTYRRCDYQFDLMEMGVYWGVRNPVLEGDILYKHHFAFHWRPHFSWS